MASAGSSLPATQQPVTYQPGLFCYPSARSGPPYPLPKGERVSIFPSPSERERVRVRVALASDGSLDRWFVVWRVRKADGAKRGQRDARVAMRGYERRHRLEVAHRSERADEAIRHRGGIGRAIVRGDL